MRLLYVALTRAEVWLMVAAAGDVGSGTDSWHATVADGMVRAGAAAHGDPVLAAAGLDRVDRLQSGVWPAAEPGSAVAGPAEAIVLPGWAVTAPPVWPENPRPLSPSDLGGAKALPGEGGAETEVALRQGRQLHLLLEHLPDWPGTDWPGLAREILAADATETETEHRLAQARQLIEDPRLAAIFAPGTLAEVELSATLPELQGRQIRGTVDRLCITPDRVLAVDFKTNAVIPARAEDVPDGILRQMGAYAAALRQIYPGRSVEVAVLWTRSGTLMPLPTALVLDALGAVPAP